MDGIKFSKASNFLNATWHSTAAVTLVLVVGLDPRAWGHNEKRLCQGYLARVTKTQTNALFQALYIYPFLWKYMGQDEVVSGTKDILSNLSVFKELKQREVMLWLKQKQKQKPKTPVSKKLRINKPHSNKACFLSECGVSTVYMYSCHAYGWYMDGGDIRQ